MALILTTIILILNIFFLKSPVIGLIFGLAYIFSLSRKISKKFEPNLYFSQAFLILISLISAIGAVVYFAYKLDNIAISVILAALPALIHKIPLTPFFKGGAYNNKEIPAQDNKNDVSKIDLPTKNSWYAKLLIPVYLILNAVLFHYLFIFQTDSAIRSPWKVIPQKFLLIYFVAAVILIVITLSSKKKVNLILVSLHFLLSSTLALIIYKLGYGFDQFVHIATEKVILNEGAIHPKPLYYLGQYSLVIFFSKIFSVGAEWVDKLLVIFSFAIILPSIAYNSLKDFFGRSNFILFLATLLLIFHFSSFIVTTPQNLANLFILLLIFLALPYIENKEKSLLPLYALTAATLAIHPLAGIPAIIFLGLILMERFFTSREITKKKKEIIFASFLILGSIIVPAIFLLNSYASGLEVNISAIEAENFRETVYNSQINFVNNFNFAFDFIYFYKFNFYWILFLVSIITILASAKKTKKFFPYFFSFAILFTNFLILKLLFSFDFLIDYEKGDYTRRIFEISFYFLYPIALYGIYKVAEKISGQKFYIKLLSIFFIAGIITSSFYISYPRSDDYEDSHLFNTTASDIEAVNWIENDAGGQDFIVLANQQVSAAALREFGFKKYFGDQFYYPIPTSSSLYANYLKMVDDSPKREYIEEAMENVGVRQGYFVINDYWWRFKEISEEAKKSADFYKSIDNGHLTVFKYIIK